MSLFPSPCGSRLQRVSHCAWSSRSCALMVTGWLLPTSAAGLGTRTAVALPRRCLSIQKSMANMCAQACKTEDVWEARSAWRWAQKDGLLKFGRGGKNGIYTAEEAKPPFASASCEHKMAASWFLQIRAATRVFPSMHGQKHRGGWFLLKLTMQCACFQLAVAMLMV